MGFSPLIRQNALSITQWSKLIYEIVAPMPADAMITGDHDYDTDSDAGWYPPIPEDAVIIDIGCDDTESDAGWYPDISIEKKCN